jgi:hypothetical protein
MNLLAFATPRHPGEWRWRIVGYTLDDVMEESTAVFPTMAGALAAGQLRVSEINTRESAPGHSISRSVTYSRYR